MLVKHPNCLLVSHAHKERCCEVSFDVGHSNAQIAPAEAVLALPLYGVNELQKTSAF